MIFIRFLEFKNRNHWSKALVKILKNLSEILIEIQLNHSNLLPGNAIEQTKFSTTLFHLKQYYETKSKAKKAHNGFNEWIAQKPFTPTRITKINHLILLKRPYNKVLPQ